MKKTLLIATFLITLLSCDSNVDANKVVKTVEEFNTMVLNAKPGDKIILANGNWEDAELIFEGKGTKEQPITLTAEEKGKVNLIGNSNLKIAGEYMVVEGLIFKDGYTKAEEVISFKKDDKNLAYNSRVTECVIVNYSKPERQESDYWIGVYGKNNRFDHNHIEGKTNKGVTMAVRLNTLESQENNHRIDHNYFGPRSTLGSNGGETLRIGTSHYSLTNSKTIVEYNYFDRCNGEREVISNKSGQNTFRYNMFYECTGTLTLRHGNQNLVDGNVFIGNNKPSTGGIRVINAGQKIINNYGYGLKGYRFGGAFVIMNGVPNSKINRYHQVKDAVVENNVFVNSDHIQLGAGSDEERSAVPKSSIVANNIFYHDTKKDIFTIYDDMSGITFKNNILSENISAPFSTGFSSAKMTLKKNEMGYKIPVLNDENTNFKINSKIATKKNTGAPWYSKESRVVVVNSGKIIEVKPGQNTLYNAAVLAKPGDILNLEAGQKYTVDKVIKVDFPLSVVSNGEEKSIIFSKNTSLFNINNGGSLSLKGIKIDGGKALGSLGKSVIKTSEASMDKNYKLFIDNCDFVNLGINNSYNVLEIYKNTFADTISIKNSNFSKISGNVLKLDKENDDKGIYNAEYVILTNNSFSDIDGTVLTLYRGGKDESTFGPFLEIDHNVFNKVGNNTDATIDLYGVQEIHIKNSIFKDSKALKAYLVVGEPIVNIENNNFYNSEALKITGDQKYNTSNLMSLNPKFLNDKFMLSDDSPLINKGTDGKNLGLLIQ